jgi:hypothetical protein
MLVIATRKKSNFAGRMKSFCQHRKTPVLESVADAAILNRSRSPIQSIESPRALLPSVVFLHNQLMLTTSSRDLANYQEAQVLSCDQYSYLNCFIYEDLLNETDSLECADPDNTAIRISTQSCTFAHTKQLTHMRHHPTSQRRTLIPPQSNPKYCYEPLTGPLRRNGEE